MSGGGSNPELPNYMAEWLQDQILDGPPASVEQVIASAQHTAKGGCPSCQCVIAGWCLDGCLTKKEYPL